MYGMTPEERFTTIENLLAALTETQVRNEAQLEAHNATIDKQNSGIRDLVVVSRTLVDAQMKASAQISELREAQQVTDEKLHMLIETVDRLIRHREK
jgi:hypothetical protein